MKLISNTISLLFTFFYLSAYCQWSDSFTDGELENNPTWQGDIFDFTIADGVLKLNAQSAGISLLFTELQLEINQDLVWEFKIRQNFSPSGNNYSRIFLWSEHPEFFINEDSASSTAYFLQFGEGGTDDAVELFRINEGSSEPISICRGIEGNIASPFVKKYRVIYSQGAWHIWSGNWEDPYYFLETSGIDYAPQFAGYFALSLNYTSSNTQKFYFDDIKTGIYFPDTLPPEILDLTVISANELLLGFSEAVDSSALIGSHYNVNATSPEIISFPNPAQQEVILNFTDNFPANQPLTLNIDSLWDLAGNIAFNLSFDFIWNPPFEADSTDILFNEILPDPTPLVGLPEAEFIELFNASDSIINLNGYTFYNSSIPIYFPEYIFEPGAFLIICDEDDTSLFENYSTVLGLPVWPALVNSGDSLTLINPSGGIIDRLVYNVSWYGDNEKAEGGWSLERINPIWPCEIENNWSASENENGGTPGAVNSIFNNEVDTIAPEIFSIKIITNEMLLMSITEIPQNLYLTYEQVVIPGLEIISIEFEESLTEDLLLLLSEPLTEDTIYTAYLQNVQDCWGNMSHDSLNFNSGFFTKPGDVVFNELMVDPSPPQLLPDAEYIELYNTTDHSFNANNWQLKNSGVLKSIPPFVLKSKAYIILCREQDSALFAGYGEIVGLPSWSILANTQDSLGLINEKGLQIAGVAYKKSWYDDAKNGGGWSLERINPNVNCNGKTNWMASENISGGTPGSTNSVAGFEIINEINIWQAFIADSNLLDISFTGEPDSLSVFNSEYFSSPDLELSLDKFAIKDDGFDLIFIANSTPVADTLYRFTINGIESCNKISINSQSIDFGLAIQAEEKEIVINEILFHPFTGGSDFLELKNVSSHFIDLRNWRLIKSDGIEVIEESFLSDRHLVLPPGGLIAMSRIPEELSLLYPLSTNKSNLFQLAELPNFNNAQGIIILKNNLLKTIDSLYYSEEMHFSLLDDLKGISLERISPIGQTSDPFNWASASEASGYATPGTENSQLYKSSNGGLFSLDPELFTPDNDGYHDQLHINYKLSNGGWMGSIRIFNDKGIEVRRLINNDWLGSEGSTAWDGTDNNGEKAPVGIYIVYFELFNAQGEKQLYKNPCVLGSKL